MQKSLATRDLSAGDMAEAIKVRGGAIPEGTRHTLNNGKDYYADGKGGWILDDRTQK